MMVFLLLTMFLGGVIMLSASLFCLNQMSRNHCNPDQTRWGQAPTRLIYDEMELPSLSDQPRTGEPDNHNALLEFTKTSRKSSKQLPLLGLPDKAFYRIH